MPHNPTVRILSAQPFLESQKVDRRSFMNPFLQRYLKPRDHVSTKSQPVPETARSVGRKKGFRVMEVH